MFSAVFYLDACEIVDYIIQDDTNRTIKFFRKAKAKGADLYTSEWAIYEAIPILVQEMYFQKLQQNGIRSIRRTWRKITREQKIPLSVGKKLAPIIKSLRNIMTIISFNELPPDVHENAQKIALTSRFSSFDALHIAIAKWLSEYGKVNGKGSAVRCYIVTSNVSDFNPDRFRNARSFTRNLVPVTPRDALKEIK